MRQNPANSGPRHLMDYSLAPKILPGLPGVGPHPRQFSATGLGMHSEGLVVEFGSTESWCWIGNFQPGMTNFSAVYADVESLEANVFAGGQGYRVNVETGELLAEFGGDIESVVEIPNGEALLLCSPTDFELHRRAGGVIWRSRRVSWDGFRNLSVHGNELKGEAWMFDDTWHPFTVVLESGVVEGGSYYEVRQE
ncbi:hypothetical protein SAMN05216303_1176 [Rhodoferax sp. OV413]|nr:hypothetical protein SAMN05216303_1176 [Rhodoferax sp. OV413]